MRLDVKSRTGRDVTPTRPCPIKREGYLALTCKHSMFRLTGRKPLAFADAFCHKHIEWLLTPPV